MKTDSRLETLRVLAQAYLRARQYTLWCEAMKLIEIHRRDN